MRRRRMTRSGMMSMGIMTMGTRRMVVTRRNVWHPIDPDDKKGDENAGDDMRRAMIRMGMMRRA